LEPASEYEKWVARLYNTPFFHPINNGLMNISILYDLMGSPLDDVSFVNYCLQKSVLLCCWCVVALLINSKLAH
jgi:hypothetical protein